MIPTFPTPTRLIFLVISKTFYSKILLKLVPLALGLQIVRGDHKATPVCPLRSHPVHRRAALLLEGRTGA